MESSGSGSKPTVVLVHGAWGDATGFDGVIRKLHDQGYRAIGFANPLRGLQSDANYLADLLKTIEGPIVLVGHSYGGAVITNAATGNGQVVGLVYVNGWALDEGESIGQLQTERGQPDSARAPGSAVYEPGRLCGHGSLSRPGRVSRRLRRRR